MPPAPFVILSSLRRQASRRTQAALAVTAVTAALVGLLAAPASAAPEPTKPVEVGRYLGRWYEIARLHNFIEQACEAPTFDFARDPAGHMSVVEACHEGSAHGPLVTHHAGVTILDPGTNAKLRLALLPFVTRDYWVLDHADDYSWALLARSTGNYLWLLTRRPDPPPAEVAAMVARAKALGYDTAKLIFPKER